MSKTKMSELMDDLLAKTDGDVSVGEVVSKFESRGFAPLLLIPALIALLPTGAIPGVPTICGITLFMICLQMALGAGEPWLPKVLKERSLNHDKLKRAINKFKPYIVNAEKILTPRLTGLTDSPASRVIALYCALVSLSMIPLEVIPFAAAVPAFAITITAVGLLNKDGVVLLIGLLLQAATGLLLVQVL
ncbi:exopolysaccharide biosynthesis protein [Alteromonas gilva]|uniref:Exopolysaccharide biosynthesis protein n=1 Tax=Alteromonas gilva TaxID=2987522 RepID=A0ABT5KY16_9ALTE|nr:exopolysaccharide biosynthesis protein [Alteromonas gilva]MDC8829532.1 exopolysaccharide biosynthesis protein [Alteromonas gilva]